MTIDGHPNYMISNLGRVKSKTRELVNKNGIKRSWPERILTSHKGGQGYLCIVLDGKNHWTHKLVASHFIPNPENKRCVHHKDSDKMNNVVSNLEWVTHKENMKYEKEKAGEDGIWGSCKLTKRQKKEIQKRSLDGESDVELAEEFGVGPACIAMLRRKAGLKLCSGPIDLISRRKRLTENQVLAIRKMYSEGESVESLSDMYSSSQSTIRRIVKHYSWKKI